MKILEVCHRYHPYIGGIEEHVENISERLAKRFDVTVCTTDPSGRLPRDEVVNCVEVKRFRSWAPNEAYFFFGKLKGYGDAIAIMDANGSIRKFKFEEEKISVLLYGLNLEDCSGNFTRRDFEK